MPIMHIVMWKLNEGVSEADIEASIEGIATLNQLDTVQSCTVGKNFCGRSQGFEVALTLICNDKADLESYAVDPFHTAVKEKHILPFAKDILAVDYEY